jgi:hypothetical protein
MATHIHDGPFSASQVYVRLALRSPDAKERVRVCEPNKCYEWAWRSVANPDVQPMFVPLEQLFKSDYWRDHVVRSDPQQRDAATLPLAARAMIAAAAVGVGVFVLARRR